MRQRAHECAYNVECGFTKLYKDPEEIFGRRIAGRLYGKHALCHLPAPGISGTRQRFLAGEPLFPGCTEFWAIFCFIQFQIRRSSWMLALSWEMETLCAAMEEAFCIWQGLRAGTGIKRKLGNNQAGCGLGVFHC